MAYDVDVALRIDSDTVQRAGALSPAEIRGVKHASFGIHFHEKPGLKYARRISARSRSTLSRLQKGKAAVRGSTT